MKKCLLFLVFATSVMAGVAQNTLGVSIFKQSADTLYYNQTLSLSVFNAFYGPQGTFFSGSIGLKYSINGVTQTDTLTVSGANPATIYANTAVLGNVEIPINTSKFAGGGGHTIIVWPIVTNGDSLGVANHDSVKIYVAGWLGVEKHILDSELYIFPNPCKTNLSISNSTDTPIKAWQIVGLDGRVMLENKSVDAQNLNIDVRSLSAGVYVLKFIRADGAWRGKKFLKE
jgi:hypothetical protein